MHSHTPRPLWQLPLLVLALAALVFAALRLALRAAYPHYFADTHLLPALLTGARFDLKLAVIALAPCLLWWLVPTRRARVATAWLAFALLVVLLGLGIADLAYFGEVSRHIGSDLLNIGGDIGSIIGIQASLTSVPALPNREPIGFGLELNNMSRIAELAQKQGYRTLMLQTSNRRSFHIDGVAKAIGFQEYYGKEDVPIIRAYPQDPPPFGWDYDSLMYFGKQISSKPEPFFAFFFSGTTHEPYARSGKEFDTRPHAETGENGFLNTLQYSDWSVAQFMQYAAQQPWHNNTIYIFMADHTRNEPIRSDSVREQYHIPLIVYHPQWQPEKHSELASQYDILPTLADWLGIQQPVYTFGRSLANRQTRANELPLMLNHGDDAYILSPNGIAPLAPGSLKTNAASFGEAKTLESNSAWQQDLQYEQWRIQTADQKLRHNQWAQ